MRVEHSCYRWSLLHPCVCVRVQRYATMQAGYSCQGPACAGPHTPELNGKLYARTGRGLWGPGEARKAGAGQQKVELKEEEDHVGRLTASFPQQCHAPRRGFLSSSCRCVGSGLTSPEGMYRYSAVQSSVRCSSQGRQQVVKSAARALS